MRYVQHGTKTGPIRIVSSVNMDNANVSEWLSNVSLYGLKNNDNCERASRTRLFVLEDEMHDQDDDIYDAQISESRRVIKQHGSQNNKQRPSIFHKNKNL